MNLCLNIGNTHLYGGLFSDQKLQFQFRYPSAAPSTSDQLGVFLKSILRENHFSAEPIEQVAIASVVPSLNYSIRAAFLKYFALEPFFLEVNAVKDIEFAYEHPQDIGADRVSHVIAATKRFPKKDIIIVSLGTATTFDVIVNTTYLGGIIMPGIYISMTSLAENTAKLSAVDILKPQQLIGTSTITNIQSGLYYSHLGALKEILARINAETFAQQTPIVIGTGGFANLFEPEHLFDFIIPELVLQGLAISLQSRQKAS